VRILFVTQYFPPETGAAPARAAHFARALQRAGHEVRVVTGYPNHPSGVFKTPPRGRTVETLDGITVERVWLYATPRKTAWRRLWNHLSFALFAFPALSGAPRPAVVLASMPPLFLGASAWIAARLHRAPLVLDMRDDWPHAAVSLGELRPGAVTSVLAGIATFLQKRAERIVAVTPGMLRQFEARGLESRRMELITNGADTDLFDGAAASAPAERGPFTVLYAGTHGLVHGMDVILDAAERLRHAPDIRFLLVGDGVAKAPLERAAVARGLGAIEFRPSLPPAELAGLIRAADVCLATTRDHPFTGETIPVKLFDYLAGGRPVVAAVRGDAADVVTASGGGIVVAPEDGGMLAAALLALRDDPARRAALAAAGPAFIAAHYSRRVLGERLVRCLDAARLAAHGRGVAVEPTGAYGVTKAAIDRGGALLLLAALALPMLVIAALVRLDSPGPVLFRQRRSGQGSREFTIFKFRTMRTGTPDLATHLIGSAKSHVTPLGVFLRRCSLDELPQLLNVLRGDMSLVGPRPALHNQHDLIAMRAVRGIDALRPGVTGWAQVNGRDAISMEEKVAADAEYRARVSLAFDLRILVRTVGVLFSSRGVA
jgi:lipopolysaccharide/colanic/teichoic acid biosynthesis glycosyltransferase/glycosyltransferase involved in cell wall biosynthesis